MAGLGGFTPQNPFKIFLKRAKWQAFGPWKIKIVPVSRMMLKKEEAPAAPMCPSDNDLLKEILAALKK